MEKLKYSEILKLNNELRQKMSGSVVSIRVLSNIVVHYLKNILEYFLRVNGTSATVILGDYDNIIQDATDEEVDSSGLVIIFWEISNLIDGFNYRIETMSEIEIDALKLRLKNEIDLTFKALTKSPLVLFNCFSSTIYTVYNLRSNKLDSFVEEINTYVRKNKPPNVHLVSLENIFHQISINDSINFRDYFSSKCLYTVNFFKAYSEHVLPLINSLKGKSKKALIFDCDNTLWDGILGEDGFNGIKMSSHSKATAYEEVQFLAKELSSKGIIIGLCSKNNQADIDQVIQSHPDFRLTNEEIVIKEINWDDKVTNLRRISEKLNIGLDSIVFVDDSDFEVNHIRSALPMVEVIQVPIKSIYNYPNLIRKSFRLFFNISLTNEDSSKTQMYKNELVRKDEQKFYSNLEQYLSSLELQVTIYIDDESIVQRLAQLTQKTNQFNLTTKRYTDNEVINFMHGDNSVFAFSVKDKFGESGITGLALLKMNSFNEAVIDSLLMSCRVLGRNIELTFMDFIIGYLQSKGISIIKSVFVPSKKNYQVASFYEKLGFTITSQTSEETNYTLNINQYSGHKINYIKVVVNESKN